MAKWYFVRHGQSQYNAGLTTAFNSEMTQKGIDQATRAAMTLRDDIKNPGDFVGIVSPYTRCLQTALIISKYTGIKFKVDHRPGESPEEIHRNGAQIFSGPHAFPDFDWSKFGDRYWPVVDYTGESETTYKERIVDFLKALKDDQNYVVVSHMTPTVHMLRELCFEGKREDLTIGNCSISLVEDRKPVYIGKNP